MLPHPPLYTSTAWQSDEFLNAWGLIFVLQGLPWEHYAAQGLANLVPRVPQLPAYWSKREHEEERSWEQGWGPAAWLASILILCKTIVSEEI